MNTWTVPSVTFIPPHVKKRAEYPNLQSCRINTDDNKSNNGEIRSACKSCRSRRSVWNSTVLRAKKLRCFCFAKTEDDHGNMFAWLMYYVLLLSPSPLRNARNPSRREVCQGGAAAERKRDKKEILSLICGVEYSHFFTNQWTVTLGQSFYLCLTILRHFFLFSLTHPFWDKVFAFTLFWGKVFVFTHLFWNKVFAFSHPKKLYMGTSKIVPAPTRRTTLSSPWSVGFAADKK